MGVFSFLGKGNILYYPGCLSKYVLKAETENYKKILNKLGVDFIMLPNELCCGSPVRNAGYEVEDRKLARKNFDIFKEHNIKKIITNCPACFKTLGFDYKEMLSDWNIEVEYILTTILRELKEKQIKKRTIKKITYHDPCHLGRHVGMYEEPRQILSLLGYEIVEMIHNKEEALCCGAGAGLRVNNPKLASKIVENRIKEAVKTKSEKLITSCPLCFSHLSNDNIEVEELSYTIADALALKAEKTDIQKISDKSSGSSAQEVCS